jgi:hypothetical protein
MLALQMTACNAALSNNEPGGLALRLTLPFTAICVCCALGGTPAVGQDPTAPVISEEQKRIVDNQQAQKRVDNVYEKTTDLVTEFQTKLKIVDGLQVYNALLAKQLAGQDADIETLRASIANATVIERQMVPLLMRMLDSLEEFIEFDVPFLKAEREERVAKLRVLMEQPELTVAEKCRRVFEAFQIENDFGRTLEAYKGKLNLADKSFDVDYLRIGRIALLYRSVGNDQFGHWDNAKREWVQETESQYQRSVDKGLRIARTEMAPELFAVPVQPPEDML